MRFTRFGRSDRFEWTSRKLAIAKSHGARTAAKQAQRYPLLADVLPSPQAFDAIVESDRRNTLITQSEASLRAFHAHVWREARRNARNALIQEQAAIRDAWAVWTGPTTSTYYTYIVDLHTGALAKRDCAMKAKAAAIRAELSRGRLAQYRLDLEVV